MSREGWGTYFLDLADKIATRSTCDRLHVGALVVKDKRILSTGYNGSLKGSPHCDDEGHDMHDGHCVRTVHAEANALIVAAKYGIALEGAEIYCTHLPCLNCFKLIHTTGIKRIIYREIYPKKGYKIVTDRMEEIGAVLSSIPKGRDGAIISW